MQHCFLCGHWVEEPRWFVIASVDEDAVLESLGRYHVDDVGGCWVCRCLPVCDAAQVIRRLQYLRDDVSWTPALVQELYDLYEILDAGLERPAALYNLRCHNAP